MPVSTATSGLSLTDTPSTEAPSYHRQHSARGATGRLWRATLCALGGALLLLPSATQPVFAQFAPVPPIQLPTAKPGVAGAFVAMTQANQRIYAPNYVIGDGWAVLSVSLPYGDPSNPVSPSPAPIGSLSMFLNWGVTPWIVYRAAGGQVYQNTFQPWNSSPAMNVTAASGAPVTVSELIGFDSGNGYNSIFYRGTNGHICELYRPRQGGANWQVGDLAALTGAPLAAGDPAGFVRGDWYSAVIYRGADRQIYELHLPPSGGEWGWGSPSALAQAPLAKGNPSGFARWDSVTSIVYRGMDDHIHELYLPLPAQVPGAAWKTGDLTLLTMAPRADGDPVGWAFSKKQPLPGGVTQTDRQNCVAYRSQRPASLPLDVLCLETGRMNSWHRFTGM